MNYNIKISNLLNEKNEEETKINLAQKHENIKMIKLQKEYEETYEEYPDNNVEDELDDEKDWTWYDPQSKDIFFIVSTNFPYYNEKNS